MPHDRDYEVGYGKPPQHTRFKKGQSGNPRGRAKRVKNLAAVISETLDEPITVTENGRRRKITKRVALVKQYLNGAVQGDAKSAQIFLRLLGQIDGSLERGPPPLNVIRFGADARP